MLCDVADLKRSKTTRGSPNTILPVQARSTVAMGYARFHLAPVVIHLSANRFDNGLQLPNTQRWIAHCNVVLVKLLLPRIPMNLSKIHSDVEQTLVSRAIGEPARCLKQLQAWGTVLENTSIGRQSLVTVGTA